MLQALEPRVRLEQGAALSPRLQAMLEKKRLTVLTATAQSRLEKTLTKAQEARKAETPKEQKPEAVQRKADKP